MEYFTIFKNSSQYCELYRRNFYKVEKEYIYYSRYNLDCTDCDTYDIKYTLDGLNHNRNGPAFTQIHYGDIKYEEYCIHGNKHRIDGAAQVSYIFYPDIKDFEDWYLNGKLHRLGGPAAITYDTRYLRCKCVEECDCNNIQHYITEADWYENDVFLKSESYDRNGNLKKINYVQ